MSMECPSSQVYRTAAEQKLKSKNAAKIYRFGTPKLRDLLREKCRIRLKETRQQGFAQNREGLINDQCDLKIILRRELAELEHDLILQDEIYNELADELNEWFVGQLEEEQNYLVEVADAKDLVCPLCQISNLVVFPSKDDSLFNYRCKCGANFFFQSTLDVLRVKLCRTIDEHEQHCLSKLCFFVNPLSSQLEGMCEHCDYFYT